MTIAEAYGLLETYADRHLNEHPRLDTAVRRLLRAVSVDERLVPSPREQWLDTFNARVSAMTGVQWPPATIASHASEFATLVHGYKPEGMP